MRDTAIIYVGTVRDWEANTAKRLALMRRLRKPRITAMQLAHIEAGLWLRAPYLCLRFGREAIEGMLQ
jgi:hypothetical protein